MSAQLAYGVRDYCVRGAAAAAATLITLAMSAAFTPPSLAADLESRTAIVRYDDLNLHTRAGAAALERRVAGAVESVCRRADTRSLVDRAREAACRQDAAARAQPQLQQALATVGQSTHFTSAASLVPASPGM